MDYENLIWISLQIEDKKMKIRKLFEREMKIQNLNAEMEILNE